MSRQIINLGVTENDHAGTQLKAGGDMINDMSLDLYNVRDIILDLTAKEISESDDIYAHEGHFIVTPGTGNTFLCFVYISNKTGGEGTASGKATLRIFDFPSLVHLRTITLFDPYNDAMPDSALMLAPRVYRVGDVLHCVVGDVGGLYERNVTIVGDDANDWTVGALGIMAMTMLNSSGVNESLSVTPANIQTHLEKYFGDTYSGYVDCIPILRNFDHPVAYGGNLYSILELNGEFTNAVGNVDFIIKSTDSGATWTLTYPLNYTTSARNNYIENSLVFVGSVMHVISRVSGAIAHLYSANLGVAWTVGTLTIPGIATKPTAINYYKVDKTLGVMLAYNVAGEYIGSTQRTTLIIYSTDDFVTLTEVAKISVPSFVHYPTLYAFSNALYILYTKGLKMLMDTSNPTAYDRNTIVLTRVY
jgi:hypothetical protein